MKIVIFGLSITSSWGNGHATTFRALCRALSLRGHEIVFFERNTDWYESNRDMPAPSFCTVRIFESWRAVLPEVRKELSDCDVAIVGSYFPNGIEALDEVLDSQAPVRAFYDIDTPITLAQLRSCGKADYLESKQIAGLDLYFSFTSGPILREIEDDFGAKKVVPLYCSFDPEQYQRFPVTKRFSCDLSYMGTYAADRQPKIDELLCATAREMPDLDFLVAGPQYPKTLKWPVNVRRITHLNPRWHARFYSSSRLTLNVTRHDMVLAGYSPSVRLFEAAACGTTIISDRWAGLEQFLTPGREVLVPSCTADVVTYLRDTDEKELREIGMNARVRVLREHTNSRRAQEFEKAVESALSTSSPRASLPAGVS